LLADSLRERGVHLRILNLGIDTATPAGALVLTMMAGLAKFERQVLRERQRRGIDAARLRGKHLGRPRLLDRDHAETAIKRLRAGDTLSAIAREWRVSERTVSRLVRKHAGDGPPPTLPGGRGKPKRRGRIMAIISTGQNDEAIVVLDVSNPARAKVVRVLWKRGPELDVLPRWPLYRAATGQFFFVGVHEPNKRNLYKLPPGEGGRAVQMQARARADQLEGLFLSPDGRYLLFNANRPERQ
jgi:Resolvase, N terminal domain/Homeodomain-like domain